MIRTNYKDEFFYKQPDINLREKYEEYYIPEIIFDDGKRKADTVAPKGLYLIKGAYENEILLETSWYDFKLFTQKNNLSGSSYPIKLQKTSGYEKQEYEIEITNNECIITAGETEGIRRALIAFEDMLVMGGGNVRKGITHRKTPIERIMSRCFFAPIGRPPRMVEELGDDVEYYSDGYLNKFMRTGVNTVWVYTDFDRLLKSSYIEEFGSDSEKHLKKLNAIVERLKTYGIEVFAYLIAPMSLYEPHLTNRYGKLYEKYKDVTGNSHAGPPAFCTYTEFGEKYLADAVERFMKEVPGIAGILNVSYGERVTSCGNTWPDIEGGWTNNCPHCSDKSRMEIVTHTIGIFVDSMKKVNPNAEFIAWTYGHRDLPYDEIQEYFEKVPDEVITMQGFEDDGRAMQLGRERFAIDYWLSYAGPSQMYKFSAKHARINGKRIYSKMQICTSHELSTVPYIPAPGIIYDKMTSAKALGSTGVLEGWYFGTCPSLMTRAVGLLSTDAEYANKREFLEELASLYVSANDVEKIVDAWENFEKAYSNYPLNVLFSYYGPMHDGVVWELSLLPKNFSLPESWKLTDKPDGDRLGDCLYMGHTAEEAVKLTEKMVKYWQKGLEDIKKTSLWLDDGDEMISIVKALELLFKSGCNIVTFYKLRNDLGYGRADACEILSRMKNIVLDEIENSKAMIPLCEKDMRLGYHSEAEGYKFFPEKLRHRIAVLEKLLVEEFTVVAERINNGQTPLSYFDGDEEGIKKITAGRNGLDSATWQYLDDGKTKFRVAVGEYIEIEIKGEKKEDYFFTNEFELFFPDPTMIIRRDGRIAFHRDAHTHQSLRYERKMEELKKWQGENLSNGDYTHVVARIKKCDTRFIRLPYKFSIHGFDGSRWCKDPLPFRSLGKCTVSPADFGWII